MEKKKTEIYPIIIIAVALVVCVTVLLNIDHVGTDTSLLPASFEYDLSQLVKIDPDLITYKESKAPIETDFKISRAIALDKNKNIYVAGDNSVKTFSSQGRFLNELLLFAGPTCLAVNKDAENSENKLFVAVNDHVEVYNSNNELNSKWQGLGAKAFLTSIDIYKDNVFVADAGNRIVLKYDLSGNLKNRIGKKNKENNIEGFVIPSGYFDLAVGSDGLLRTTNPGKHRIEAYTFDGFFEFWWGKAGSKVEKFCGCCNPCNFAIMSDGRFVTSEKGLYRIKIYDENGIFKEVVAGVEQLLDPKVTNIGALPSEANARGFDVAVDDSNAVYVLDTIKNQVRFFIRKED